MEHPSCLRRSFLCSLLLLAAILAASCQLPLRQELTSEQQAATATAAQATRAVELLALTARAPTATLIPHPTPVPTVFFVEGLYYAETGKGAYTFLQFWPDGILTIASVHFDSPKSLEASYKAVREILFPGHDQAERGVYTIQDNIIIVSFMNPAWGGSRSGPYTMSKIELTASDGSVQTFLRYPGTP